MSDEPDAFEIAENEKLLRTRGWHKDRRTGQIRIGHRWEPGELMNDMGLDEADETTEDGPVTELQPEHIASADCWCAPVRDERGVWVHHPVWSARIQRILPQA
jgi:hypothetical protein